MVDLNNIFNKFFPKSQTSPTGKKLIYMAWAIEITVAMVGFAIAATFVLKGKSEAEQAIGGVTSSTNFEYVIMALAFFVVGIMELTKIPLATALYYSVKTFWKIIFFLALLAVNFSTFETIIQGFELAFNERSKIVNVKRKQLENLRNQKKSLLEEKSQEGDFDKEISLIQKQISDLNQDISNINLEANNQIAKLKEQNELANPRSKSLAKQIDEEKKKLNQLIDNKNKLELSLQEVSGLFQGGARKSISDKISLAAEDIKSNEKMIENLQRELDLSLAKTGSQNIPQIDLIKQNANIRIDNIKKQIDNIVSTQLNVKQAQKGQVVQKKGALIEEQTKLQQLIDQKIKEVNEITADSQIYRLALKIKVLFSNEKDTQFTEADLTQKDIDNAFWIWFGFLGFIISIIGTLVALAGLHLMDERMHEIRNQPLNRKNTLNYRIGRMLVSVSRYLSTRVQIFLKPRIVEKIIEKEVEVEKIVDRPVYEEKIVYQTVEVPKEVTRKEIVHVPLWTQDPDLLNKKIDLTDEIISTKKKK